MTKKHRRRKKKRSVVIRRVSSFIQTHDPVHLHSVGIVFLVIIVAIAWWTDGWNEAVLYFKALFFFGLGISAGLDICGLIIYAVRGLFAREDLIHAAVKLPVIGIALIATEDHIGVGTKAAIGGIGFAVFISIFTIVLSFVSNWFRR